MRKILLLLIIITFTNCTNQYKWSVIKISDEWSKLTSSNKKYSIIVPTRWQGPLYLVKYAKNIPTFIDNNTQSELTVSFHPISYCKFLSEKDLLSLYPDEIPAISIRKEFGDDWHSIYREYKNQEIDYSLYWYVKIIKFDNVVVIITLKCPKNKSETKLIFDHICGSITINNRKISSSLYPYQFSLNEINEIINKASIVYIKTIDSLGYFKKDSSIINFKDRFIPKNDAYRIIISSIPAALCYIYELNWEEYYLAFMELERSKDWDNKQISFIGFLFGYAQETFLKNRDQIDLTKEQQSYFKTSLDNKAIKISKCR